MTEEIAQSNQDKVGTLKEMETYKYLGILEADTIKQAYNKENMEKEYFSSTRTLLETKLHWNLIKEINTWDVPILRYPKPLLKWTREGLLQMDQRTSKLMMMHKALNCKDDVNHCMCQEKEKSFAKQSR